ncbi:MAG: hypothetical protein IKH51_11675 [Clostridia bacterium]|jgi:hypothetical protein|nr:hypothetical protein [Clostridia bacterium]
MLSLIVGVKGTGKTKHLIDLTDKALASSNGSVVCLEKGNKLRYDVKYQVRLIDTSEYYIEDGQALYGFVAGILASDHDITHLFIDSALKICKNNTDEFDVFLDECARLVAQREGLDIVMTASIAVESVTEVMKKYIEK